MSEAGAAVPARQPGERASLADWMAVGAGTIGSMMALLDVSIINSALPVIQGEIGATPSEGTWVGTSYLIAEIMTIPLVAWLQRWLGMRVLLLTGAIFFTLFSMLCGFASSLEMMIMGRIGQGLAGGVLIPTALTIVVTRLPPSQQAIGLAMTASAALLGPVSGPLLGGWLTENLSWHFAFFINAPICVVQIVMVMIAIPKEPGDWSELRNADWAGIAGMAIGLGSITTLLEEGHREHWFESALIWQLAAAAGFGFCLVALGQLRARRPVLRLSLLRNRTLASALMLMTVVGLLLFSCLFITPQFLAIVAGYNAFQAGQVAFTAGMVAIPAAFLYPVLEKVLGGRGVTALAVFAISLSAWLAAHLTALSTGSDLFVTQLLYGMGTTLSAIPLQQVVFSTATVEEAPEANSLMSVARNLGGSIGLAAIASFQDQRLEFHHWRINESIVGNDGETQHRIAEAGAMLGGGEGVDAAIRALDGEVMLQALVMTFNDMYLALALAGLLVLPLVLIMQPSRAGGSALAVH